MVLYMSFDKFLLAVESHVVERQKKVLLPITQLWESRPFYNTFVSLR